MKEPARGKSPRARGAIPRLGTPGRFRQVGKSVARLDGQIKVTGALRYTADLRLPEMIWGKCLRSPFAHARLVRVDASEARRLPGVRAVLTGADLPRRLLGRRLKDIPVLAQGTVRFIGEKVAAVAADSREIAEEAVSLIRAEYEELPAVYRPEEAIAAGAPVLHEALSSYENLRTPLPELPNVHSHVQWLCGDPERGFAESDFIFEQTFSTQRVHHGYLEPHAVMVAIDAGERILVWYPAKGPYASREHLAHYLGVEEKKIAFQLSPVGGDYGGKGSIMDAPVCVELARASGRPVMMAMNYQEELTAANPRHPSTITIKTGVKKDGRLWARQVKALFNSGAYAGFKNNETVNLPGARHGAGAYAIPNVKIDAFSVYTNCVPSGIMRAPGEAQMVFAVESHMDHVARRLGIDPLEFRRVNVVKRGDVLPSGVRVKNDNGKRLLDEIAARARRSARAKKPHTGRGIAFCIREVGAGEANIEAGLTETGAIYILTTVPDTGTGAHTIFRQIVGEMVGVPAETIEVVMGTTDSFPTDVIVAASRVTYLAGQAARQAGIELRKRLAEEAARLLGCAPEAVKIAGGAVRAPGKSPLELAKLAARLTAAGRALKVRGNFKVAGHTGDTCFFAQVAEVKVDPETGKVECERIALFHDVGMIINPLAHQGQIEGAMATGLGYALMENLADEEGRILTANLGDYKLPSMPDMPPRETVLIEDRSGPGPFHSKPVGEHGTVPTAPAIANAIYDALGVQIHDLPLSAEKVYSALKKRDGAVPAGS